MVNNLNQLPGLPAVTNENYFSPECNMAYMGSSQFKASASAAASQRWKALN